MKKQVFLSYASEDIGVVKQFYADLQERGVEVWFDREDLKPGKWRPQVIKAITQSSFFVICLSGSALKKAEEGSGFQDEELQVAYDIARSQSKDNFTIVPVRLEKCARGDHRLSVYQQYDLFENWDETVDRVAILFGSEASNKEKEIDSRRKIASRKRRIKDRTSYKPRRASILELPVVQGKQAVAHFPNRITYELTV